MFRRLAAREALSHRDFRVLLPAATCHAVGMGGEQVVIGLLVFELTGSSGWVGATFALYCLPLLLFGIAVGALSDWMDRRKLLCISEGAIALLLGLFAFLASKQLSLAPILVLTFGLGAMRAVTSPVMSSYTYDLVGGGQVVPALGLLNLARRAGQLLGALIAGRVTERFSADRALLILALSHVLGLLLLSLLRSVGASAEKNRSTMLDNLKEYTAELKSNRILLMLVLITAAVELFGFSFATVLPQIAKVRLQVGAEGLGWMHAARAIGGMIAGATLASVGNIQGRGTVFMGVIFSFGGALLMLTLAPDLPLTLLALVFVAAMASSSDILTQSMMQLSVPNKLRGRAMGVWIFAIGAAPFGHLQIGALAEWLGLNMALALNGALLIACGITAMLIAPSLRKL